VHVGYPELVPEAGVTPAAGCGWLGVEEQKAGPTIAAMLNGTIYWAAQASDAVEYLDSTHVLDGHELCTTDSWMNSIGPGTHSERGHPTYPGQVAWPSMSPPISA
jgi:hypothetical protein